MAILLYLHSTIGQKRLNYYLVLHYEPRLAQSLRHCADCEWIEVAHGNVITIVHPRNRRRTFLVKLWAQILLSSIYIAVVAIALVKKSPRLLKIFSAISIILVPVGAIIYTIHYALNGGTNHSNNPESYTEDTDTITLANPTKSGYTFTGWTGSNGTTPQTNVTIPKGSSGNKNYTAMSSFILECMDEEYSRNYDDDCKYNLYGDEFSRSEIKSGYVEDVLSRYEALTGFYEERESYSYVEDSMYVSKYYSYELA